MIDQSSQIILITGASSGIGEACARLFAAKGWTVILAARRVERLETLAAEIVSVGGQAYPVHADVTNREDLENLVRISIEQYGHIDVLLNNAGFGRLDWLEKLQPEEDIHALLLVNLEALIQVTHRVLPYMISQGRGHIINIGSLASLIAAPTYSVYAASKFGVRGFTDALRREVKIWGIHVSGVYPGSVETEFESHARIERKTGLRTPAFLRLRSDQVAQTVFDLTQKPRRMLILPPVMKPVIWICSMLPGVVDLIIQKFFVRRERQ